MTETQVCVAPSPYQVEHAQFETIWFTAADGVPLNFRRLRRASGTEDRGPLLLSAGTSVRADIFSPPTADTLPRYLSRAGYDVWVLNWRASIDLAPTTCTVEDAAVLDFPSAVDTIVEYTGADSIKAVVHCLGSCAFMLAISNGMLPKVSTVVSNASALHPEVAPLMWLKMPPAIGLLAKVLPDLNPQWGVHAPGFWPKLARTLMRIGHHECDNEVCKMSSFFYGVGFPALWRHENLNDDTHDWLSGEMAQVSTKLLTHVSKSIRTGHLIATGKYDELPTDYIRRAPATDARFAFMTGDHNSTFVPVSMARTFDHFDKYSPGRHVFQKMHGYGHLDVFIGDRAAEDVFPFILDELNRD
ncbi:alpha/beta hydrolase [Antrihabitans cavernicola]|uniref:Alpha/beta hydrolase n=1 Tax=Antrihabitans cavernicola TaxID=2495913 RepID=A0A5A7S1K6_9NOCA|nr:alpha/beta hydrolase [Spelaeibacter cavernicola]KAA0017061.1 alpha/beta hydrolase [Spelaeibacter cavernicola]